MSTHRPVVVLTGLNDPTSDYVIRELNDRGVPVARFDSGTDPVTFSAFAAPGQPWTGPLTTEHRALDLRDVRAVYHRRPSLFTAPDHLDAQQRTFVTAHARHGLGGVLGALDCLYVNHPHRNLAAEFKPRQIAEAARAGLAVPPTLITNDPSAARAFAKEHGPVVFKPLRSTTYVEDGERRTIWVRAVDPEEIDDRVSACPHLFQQAVDKVADVRVAVVGDQAFASRVAVDGDHLDWRWDYERISFSPVEVPADVRTRILRFMNALGLVFGAFDFGLGQDGRWWMYECNPNGQWAFVDPPTRIAIASAIADALEKGSPT
ncbi:ATP-grasp ribosomal peptide maturase [Streptomyces jumonjinensis]|uniref:ATP-grasp ribosomal peptide maturase n=1 Tax=Streptomyces jumonjinensis TaxID=1945 RepID=A0A646KJ17_STRJU|nr:ATP-grasp ribosomal peptide maturase [Streptomyces jumonjinensis]MQT02213.1 ATP-grasp ribosomal peptide maturase [Streptomyces jumonjinensis]